jgi:hypothetical protein
MDEDQGIPIPRGNHLRRNDGLAECGCRCEHPGFITEKGCDSSILFRRQLTEKPCPDRPSLLAFIPQLGGDTGVAEEAQEIVEASPR